MVTIHAVSSVDIVLTVHIAAVIVAFGPLFVFPLLTAAARTRDSGSLPVLYHAKYVVARRIIGPALPATLLAGLYLSAKEHAFGKAWVVVPMVLIVILMALYRFVLLRAYRLLGRQATRGNSPDGDLQVMSRRVMWAELGATAVVLLAVFVMTTKPFT